MIQPCQNDGISYTYILATSRELTTIVFCVAEIPLSSWIRSEAPWPVINLTRGRGISAKWFSFFHCVIPEPIWIGICMTVGCLRAPSLTWNLVDRLIYSSKVINASFVQSLRWKGPEAAVRLGSRLRRTEHPDQGGSPLSGRPLCCLGSTI